MFLSDLHTLYANSAKLFLLNLNCLRASRCLSVEPKRIVVFLFKSFLGVVASLKEIIVVKAFCVVLHPAQGPWSAPAKQLDALRPVLGPHTKGHGAQKWVPRPPALSGVLRTLKTNVENQRPRAGHFLKFFKFVIFSKKCH